MKSPIFFLGPLLGEESLPSPFHHADDVILRPFSLVMRWTEISFFFIEERLPERMLFSSDE